MKLGFRVKFFFNKRIAPIAGIKWDIKSIIKGYREKGDVDLYGKQHIHIYPTLRCHLNCYFCQNKFYADNPPAFKMVKPRKWVKLLNSFRNFHHIDINGGEPFLYPGLHEVLNHLDSHNVVVFTNLPKFSFAQIEKIKNRNNNISLCVSYHPLEEKREVKEFAEDFKKIPSWLSPTIHVINIPEVSYKLIRTAFAKEGVFIEALDAIVPTEHNRIRDNVRKTVLCDSDMIAIAPDLSVYHCPGLMLRNINGQKAEDYDFDIKYQECEHYGLCGLCASSRNTKEV